MGRLGRGVLGGLLGALAALGAGPASAAVQVKPLVEVGAEQRYDGYDGNAANVAALGNAELYSKLSPKLGLVAGSDEFKLKAWYAADLLYTALRGNFGVDHRAGLALGAHPSQATELKADLGFWLVQDPTSLPRLGVAQVNKRVLYTDDKLGFTLRLSGKDRLVLESRTEAAQIYDIGQPLTVTETPQLSWRRELTGRLQGLLAYRYQAFVGAPALVGQAHAALGGLQYRLSETWTGRLQGGPALYLSQAGQATPVPVAEAGLEWHGKFSELDAVVGHELVGSLGYAASAWADYGQLHWGYHPWRAWRFYADAGAFRNGLAPAVPSNFLGYAFGAGAGYSVTNEVEVQLGGQRITQFGIGVNPLAQPALDMNRNIAAVRLAWAPAFDPRGL